MQRSLIFLRVRNEVAESALHKLFWWEVFLVMLVIQVVHQLS